MSLQKEIERYEQFLEDNPVISGDGGKLCPKCDNVHQTVEDAENCCVPDEQDADDRRHHNDT